MKNEDFKRRMKSIKNELKTVKNDETTTLHMYGSIGESWWDEEAVSAKNIKVILKDITDDTIHVHINSGGGDVFDGITIHNLLKSHGAKIIVHVDGLAASAASLIAMAGDEIHMPENAIMMVHNASTFAYGNKDEIQKTIDALKTIDNAVMKSYMGKFVGTEEEMKTLLDNETWLSAQEALGFGLATQIVEEVEETEAVTDEQKEVFKNSLLSKYAAKVNVAVEPKTIIGRFKRNSNE